MEVQAARVFLWFFLYSVMGWIYESILCSATSRSLVNRGFLNGPYCPIYGFGAVLVVLLLQGVTDTPVALFFSSIVVTGVLEYFTSWLLEKLFHASWWDYHNFPFHINGRVCLYGALVFGVLSMVLMYWLHPMVSGFVAGFSDLTVMFLTGAVFALMLADTIVTVKHILSMSQKLRQLQQALDEYKLQAAAQREALREKLQAGLENLSAEEAKARLREALEARGDPQRLEELRRRWQSSVENASDLLRMDQRKEELRQRLEQIRSHSTALSRFQERRLLKAFPSLRSNEYGDALERLKEKLEELSPRRDKKD